MIRYFDIEKKPLAQGKTGVYQLECLTDADWNNSGCPDNTVLEDGIVRFKVEADYQAERALAIQSEALSKTSLNKLWLIRALKELEIYAQFKALIATDEDLSDEWYATGELNLLDASTLKAIADLGLTNEQVNAIKIKTFELERAG